MSSGQGLPAVGQHALGNRRAPTLLVFTEHFNATFSISFDLPLRALHARGGVNFSAYSQQDVRRGGEAGWQAWIHLAQPRTVILSRYGRPEGVEILRYCRQRGIAVVYHIDDDLLELPASLGPEVLQRHMAPEVVEARRTMLAECDVIYASTAALAARLRQRFPAQQVFHGIYAPYVETRAAAPAAASPATIGYMGSRGHKEDLDLAVPALVRLMEERPGLRFETFGTIEMPPALAAFGARVRHHEGTSVYTDFLARLGQLDWHLGLAPLVDEPFNRCKAPTKYIEYTGAGIPVVASEVVYADAVPAGGGAIVRGDDWYPALSGLLDDAGRRDACLQAARAHCRRAYELQVLERQVMHVATGLAPWHLARRLETFARRAAGWAGRQPRRLLARAWGPVQRAGEPRQDRPRILFVANSFLPTLQICFTRPLQPLADAGEIAWEVLADNQLHRAGRLLSGGGARWARRRLDRFRPDLIVFCRYSGPRAAQVVQWARRNGAATLLHLDDDLLNVPREIGAAKYEFHNRPERLGAVRHLLSNVDLVYCSTPVLLQRMRQHGLDARGIAARIHCPGEVLRGPPEGGDFTIGYMGIDHAHDFEVALPALVRVLQRNPQVRFELFGSIAKPPELEAFGDRVKVLGLVKSYDEFLRKFAARGWSVGICPLADTPFNRTKANNKWVEYTAVGAAVVATAGMLYDDCCAGGCGLLVTGDAQWEEALQRLVDDPDLRRSTVQAAQRRLAAEYSAEVLRGQLLEVFRLARARSQAGAPRTPAPAASLSNP